MMRADRSAGFLTLLGLTLAFAASFSRPVAAQVASPSSKIARGLRQQVRAAGTGTYVVVLAAKANLSPAYSIADRSDRGSFVYETLLATARSSQAGLLAYLQAELDAGNVTRFQSYFVINAVEVTSRVATLDAVAARPEVSRILRTAVARIHQAAPAPTAPSPQAVILTTTPGLDIIGAPDIWADFGKTGVGVVVANIDTGVQFDHPALVNAYRGSAMNHDFSFYDPAGICGGTPCDNNDHGTHTMGTIVGDDGGTNQIGAAPGATWIAAKGCESDSCSSNSLLLSGEWMLAPCAFGDDPGDLSCDSDMRPDVINNSWGGGGGETFYQATVDAWLASGIIPVFSAGNSGPGAGSMGAPGDFCNVIGVGATDLSDVVARFSSRGPGKTACRHKPDVAAPGVHTRSSVPTDSYADFQGTSMAAPHVTGCTALLLSINPGLTYAQIFSALSSTAVDLGIANFDFDYGFGRIDCRAAAGEVNANARKATQVVR